MNDSPPSVRFSRAFERFLAILLMSGSVLAPSISYAHPALQSEGDGLQVSGAKLELSATPGQVYVHNMQVGIGAQSPPVDVQITANGFGEDIDGQFQPLLDKQDGSPYSGRTFITGIDNTRFHLQPGETMPVAVTITVPNDPGIHSRYATVYIDSQVAAQGNTAGQKLGIIVPIVITPQNAEKALTGDITSLEVGAVEVGKPITAAITVRNTGSYHYKVRGSMMITDAHGLPVTTVPIDLTSTSIIPTFSRRLQMSYAGLDRTGGLSPGTYTLAVQIMREDNSLVGVRQTTFQVQAPMQICPGLANSAAIVQQLVDQEPTLIDARVANLEIAFEGTGKVTGQVAVCPYPQEPEGSPRFSAGPGEGGIGKTAIKFVMVRTDGFKQGLAHVRFHYQESALDKINPNSLFIAYRDQNAWHKLDNLLVQTGAELVQGDLSVAALLSSPVLALSGDIQSVTSAQVIPRKPTAVVSQALDNSPITLWIPIGLAVAGIVVVVMGSVLFIQMRRPR